MSIQPIKNIIILNGHALSKSYFDKLERARDLGVLNFDGIFFLEAEDAGSVLAQSRFSSQIKGTLTDFLKKYMEKPPAAHANDLLVPDHTAPHVLMQVFMDWVKNYKNLEATCIPLASAFSTPFTHNSPDGSVRALSHATWTCPLECEENLVCPHTQTNRHWDLDRELGNEMQTMQEKGIKTYRFFSHVLVDAVSCIGLSSIVKQLKNWENELELLSQGKQDKCTACIATHSHCHGIMGLFCVQRQGD